MTKVIYMKKTADSDRSKSTVRQKSRAALPLNFLQYDLDDKSAAFSVTDFEAAAHSFHKDSFQIKA